MLRSVKYGLYGAVVAGVVGGTMAFSASPGSKTVHLIVDGRPQTIHTTASDVGDVLADAGFHPDRHDLVAPSASSSIANGTTIVYKRGRLLHLDVDGHRSQVWTTADTVAGALADLGFSGSDRVSVSRSHRLPLTATDISVRRPKLVVVKDGTKRRTTYTTDTTVGQLLDDLNITLHARDQISTSLSTPIEGPRTAVTIKRIVHKLVTRKKLLPFDTRTVKDHKLDIGTTKTVRVGRPGVMRLRWALVYVNGKPDGRIQLSSQLLRRPVTQVRHVGTAVPVVTVGSAQAIARRMMASEYGWGDVQFSCLQQMWDNESDWNVHATNPSTGAYGIPQALPGSKMASAGPNWEYDATTQIRWGLEYIASRYSTPCGAWDLWQQQGWY